MDSLNVVPAHPDQKDKELNSQSETSLTQPFDESDLALINKKQCEFVDFNVNLMKEPLPNVTCVVGYSDQWFKWYNNKENPLRAKRCSRETMAETGSGEELITIDAKLSQLSAETARLINELSSGSGDGGGENWTGDMIKSQFGAIPTCETLKSMLLQPAEIKYLSRGVAEKLSLPHLIVDDQFEVCMTSETAEDRYMKVTIADDWVTGKLIFDGIENLPAVKTFINILQNNPEVVKPKYLVESGAFVSSTNEFSVKNRISFYEKLFSTN